MTGTARCSRPSSSGCSIRSPTRRRWPSSASSWSRPSTRQSSRRRPTSCARRCSPRSRTTSRRRWPPSSARPGHCGTIPTPCRPPIAPTCLRRWSTRPSGSTASSPIFSTCRGWRPGPWSPMRRSSISTTSSARRCAARARSWRSTRSAPTFPPTCQCSRWIRCCSSRCCSTCSTMPPNTRRPAPRSASAPGMTGAG